MPNHTFAGSPPEEEFDRLLELATTAEEVGFDLLTVMDHVYQIPGIGPEVDPILEGYVLLGALAARTSRLRLATLVTGVTYRNPALLAKMVTTLDVISHGRAIFGIGAAWHDVEHEGYGFEFPPIRERMDRLEEACTIARLMFTQERPSFEGTYYRIDRALNSPRPIQPGGPPIMVGGGGEQRTLRIVAKHADIANWFGPVDVLQHKDEVLLRHCEAVGRDPSTIVRTTTVPLLLVEHERDAAAALERIPPARHPFIPPGTPAQTAERLRPHLDAGYRFLIFRTVEPTTVEWVEMAGEVIRLLRG
jgi:F420-dependent oxidoreductase-like protein